MKIEDANKLANRYRVFDATPTSSPFPPGSTQGHVLRIKPLPGTFMRLYEVFRGDVLIKTQVSYPSLGDVVGSGISAPCHRIVIQRPAVRSRGSGKKAPHR